MQKKINQSWFQQIKKEGLLQYLTKGASTSFREAYSAYAQLERIQEGKNEDVGTFVLAFYQLAKGKGMLRVQRFKEAFIESTRAENPTYQYHPFDLLNFNDPILKQLVQQFYPNYSEHTLSYKLDKIYNALYHKNGVQKTAFEMAMLPTNSRKIIQNKVLAELEWQNESGLIPPQVNRLRMHEWLGQIAQAGLSIKDDGLGEITIKVKNKHPKLSENALHYFMSWAASIITTTTVILSFTAMTNPMVGVLMGMATYLGTRNSTSFGTFDLAEWFWKEGRWSITDKFLTLKNVSLKESLKALVLLASIGILAFMGAQAVFASIIGLGIWTGLGTLTMQTIALGASVWSFAASVIGLSGAIRVLTGFSFHNNQIDPIEMQAATLPTLPDESVAKLNNLKQKYNRALRHQELLHNPGLLFTKPANEGTAKIDDDLLSSTPKRKLI